MDSCFRRNGCGLGRDAALTPHDHPCESRGLPFWPFDKLRVNGGDRAFWLDHANPSYL